jgi:hypothetical protein
MDDEMSSHGSDCESSETRNNPKNDAANETGQNQNKSLCDRFWSFAESHIPPPIDENSEAGKRRKHCKEEIKFFLEAVGFIVAVIVALVFGGQLFIMRAQLTQGHNDFMQDERAWVIPSDAQVINFEEGGDYRRFVISYKNTGKTPALYVTGQTLWATNISEIHKTDEFPKSLETSGLFAPESTNHSDSTLIHESIIQEIKTGSVFYVYGTVWYDDIFGRHHWSQYCFRVFVIGNFFQFKTTNFHNSCDDAETNKTN